MQDPTSPLPSLFLFPFFPFSFFFTSLFPQTKKQKKSKKSGKQKAKFMISIEGFCLSKCFFKVMSTSWRSLDFVNPRRKAKKNQKSQKNRREKKDNPPLKLYNHNLFFPFFLFLFSFPFPFHPFPKKKKKNQRKEMTFF